MDKILSTFVVWQSKPNIFFLLEYIIDEFDFAFFLRLPFP